eukprot:487675-Pleurochrysis_carterae.AAC.2
MRRLCAGSSRDEVLVFTLAMLTISSDLYERERNGGRVGRHSVAKLLELVDGSWRDHIWPYRQHLTKLDKRRSEIGEERPNAPGDTKGDGGSDEALNWS